MTPAPHIVRIRPIAPGDRATVRTILTDSWSETGVAAHGVLYDAADLPGYIAEIGPEAAGILTYHVGDAGWEIVTIDALVAGRGIGTALLGAVEDAARSAGASRLWLITTNDNVRAEFLPASRLRPGGHTPRRRDEIPGRAQGVHSP